MFDRNNGTGDDNIIQNRFTAYLVKALRNRKINYIREKARLHEFETSLETAMESDGAWIYQDPLSHLPVIEQVEDARFQQALGKAGEQELYILFAKILQGKTFADIAMNLGMKLKTVTSIYYRLIERLRAEIGADK